MKKIFTSIILLAFSSANISAQNLVMNPSFESYSACPVGPSEFLNAINWTIPFNNVIGDTCSTSDLYNTCSPFGCFGVGVPCNILGNQAAHTGDGYAGIIAYEGFSLLGCAVLFGSGWREYVEAHFTSPLIAGQTYCVSYYVSLADNVKFATDDFGVRISPTPISVNCTSIGGSSALQPLGYTPQLTWAGGDVVDTSGWVLMQWSYVAAGGELYMVIGNFKDDAATTYTCVNANAFNPYAYYYLDDVSIVLGSCGSILSATATATNVLCNAQCTGTATATPVGGTPPYTYSWTGGQTTQTATNLCAGTYTVIVTDALSNSTTATVVVVEPSAPTAQFTIADDTCYSGVGSATIFATGGTYTYLWTPTGQTSATATGLTAGVYDVTITDANNCTTTFSVTITSTSFVATAGNDTTICPGESVTLFASGGTTYSWSNGDTTSTTVVSIEQTATYTVIVTNGSALCADTISVTVSTFAPPAAAVITQSGDTLIATPGYSSYQWYYGSVLIPGATNSNYIATVSGNYNLVVSDVNGCEVGTGILNVIASLTPTLSKGEGVGVYPNPNDGNFSVRNVSAGVELKLQISNAIGQIVFSEKLSGKKQYDIHPHLAKGIYLLRLTDDKKEMIQKLIVE